MSILYDYLKVLEKKGARQGLKSQDSIQQKRSVIHWPYLILVPLFIFSALVILLFLKNTNALIRQSVQVKTNNSQQSFNPVSQDAGGVNANNGYALDFTLKGIIYNTESPSAIINDRLVEKNTKIGDWLVTDIFSSEVRLENSKNSSLLTLKLNSS